VVTLRENYARRAQRASITARADLCRISQDPLAPLHYCHGKRTGKGQMANTDITQRSQYERSDLLARGEGIRRGSERGAAIYNVIALVIGVGLSVLAVATIDNWSQWLVLGVIVLTMIGFMIAVSPNRKG
jgi:hypothetical protein